MEILTPKKNIILDATVLSTLMSCARLTELRFNYHYQSVGGKSVSLEMGSIVHAYLENYYLQIINRMKRSEAHGFGMAAAMAYASSEEVTNCSDEDKALAFDTCELYYTHYANDSWTPLEVETVKGEVLYEDDEIRIMWKAKFDLLIDNGNGIFSVDHKTMKQRRDTITLNNQFTGQCILTKQRNVIVNKVGFQKSLKPSDRFTRVMLSYSADRLLEWQEQILPYWAKMLLMYAESGYYPPNYTHCENKYGFCAFKDVCEANRNMRAEILGRDFYVGEPWSI